MCSKNSQSKLNEVSEINNLKDFNLKTTNNEHNSVQVRRDVSVNKNEITKNENNNKE